MRKMILNQNEGYVSPKMQLSELSLEGILCDSLNGLGHDNLTEKDDWELNQ